MSKEELVFRDKMIQAFKRESGKSPIQFIFNHRPNLLMNPSTGKNLEYDFYIGKFRCGFEYQGGVHFKDIKRYGNKSDKSRYKDLLKYELILKHKTRDYCLVEIFPQDLSGNFKDNLINRINNTIDYYLHSALFDNAILLIKMLCFLESKIIYKRENMQLVDTRFIAYIKKVQLLKLIYSQYMEHDNKYDIRNKLNRIECGSLCDKWFAMDIVYSRKQKRKMSNG